MSDSADKLALPPSVVDDQKSDGVRAPDFRGLRIRERSFPFVSPRINHGCRFYGKNGMFGQLVDQGGNQCGLILDSYSPCQMEMSDEFPNLQACALAGKVRQLIQLWMEA